MTMRLPYALQRRGAALLNQQCWLWGQDIRREGGNLLLALGFHRLPAPAGQQGCTQYMRLRAGAELRLWGFGMYFRTGTGVYLNRYSFTPVCATLEKDVWTATAFEHMPPLHEGAAMSAALRSVAALEHDAQHLAGLAYRRRCLHGWRKRALPPEAMVPAWLALANDVEQLCGSASHTLRKC